MNTNKLISLPNHDKGGAEFLVNPNYIMLVGSEPNNDEICYVTLANNRTFTICKSVEELKLMIEE